MKKSEMNEKFQKLLERTKKTIKEEREKGNETAAMMYYGKVCGITGSMYAIGIIDWGQMSFIKDEAWDIYQGKEPEYEAC